MGPEISNDAPADFTRLFLWIPFWTCEWDALADFEEPYETFGSLHFFFFLRQPLVTVFTLFLFSFFNLTLTSPDSTASLPLQVNHEFTLYSAISQDRRCTPPRMWRRFCINLTSFYLQQSNCKAKNKNVLNNIPFNLYSVISFVYNKFNRWLCFFLYICHCWKKYFFARK